MPPPGAQQPRDTAHRFLALALEQARQALCLSNPNPRVGCVLVGAEGSIIGQGHTQRVGGPHAEIMALRDAQARGHSTRGATAYVTLEPCSHQGRTGPCCDALAATGIARVVAANTDPNPRVAGQGFARLRAAGVAVDLLAPADPLAQTARVLNIGFFSRMLRSRPWVRLKIAASLDGRTALENGASQWITHEAARADGHAWRARADAVLTGIGTVLNDNPRLDVRLADTQRQPWLALTDSRLQVPLDARLFISGRPLVIYTSGPVDASKRAALQTHGATVAPLPGPPGAKVDLPAMLCDLAQREVNELHVEAGPRLTGALLRAGLADELLLYLAPTLLGPGRSLAELPSLTTLAQAPALEFESVQQIGPDLRILAQLAGHADF